MVCVFSVLYWSRLRKAWVVAASRLECLRCHTDRVSPVREGVLFLRRKIQVQRVISGSSGAWNIVRGEPCGEKLVL